MRIRALVAAALVAGGACSGCNKSGPVEPALPPDDLSASVTGRWIGAETGTVGGSPIPRQTVAIDVVRTASNRVLLGGTCPDGSGNPALVTGATTLWVAPYACPAVAMSSCPSVVATYGSGTATIAQGVLSLDLAGTISGCGQRFDIAIRFDGLRDALPPVIAALSPAAATAQGPGLTLTVTGSGFAPMAIVDFGGSPLPTAFVSPGELRATVAGSELASGRSVAVAVTNLDAQVSLATTFEVRNPAPTVTSIAPPSILRGTAGTRIAVNGTGFVPTSSATCNGIPRPTRFIASTRLEVDLYAQDLAVGRDAAVAVVNPGPGGGASGPAVLQFLNPLPIPAGLFPASLPEGGPRSFVTVRGSGFSPGASATWNGSPRRAHFASAEVLSIEALPGDLATAGTAELAVVNPPPGGGTATAGTVAIETRTSSASSSVAYQVDPAHSGYARSGGTLSFPSQAAWSVTLPDSASYPLIGGGKVFVLVRGSATAGYGTRLYALDLATGATAWGPVAIDGTYSWSAHAYLDGRLFVLDFDGRLRSFDAATGTPGWSVDLPGQYAFSAPPAAEGGTVYAGGAGSGGTLYAVDAASGSVLWTASVANGDQSSPAIAPDAVYVSYPCQVYKFDRLAGALLWRHSTGCSGGGGRTTAYADGELFVRDPAFNGDPPGAVHDALDGTVTEGFGGAGALPIPAASGGARYLVHGGALARWERGGASATWTFTGAGTVSSAPIVVDDAVIVGSAEGDAIAVDAATGQERWRGAVGAGVPGPDEHNVSQPLTGLGFGEGYLVVPAGARITAWRIVAR